MRNYGLIISGLPALQINLRPDKSIFVELEVKITSRV